MNSLLRTPVLTLTISLLALNAFNVVQAEEKTIEVKAGDTLSSIIAEHYPSYKTSKTLTQAIFEANLASFKNQSVHQLIVGKTLRLPDPKTIVDLQAPEAAPETIPTNSNDKELADLKSRLKTLEAEKEQLAKQLKDLNSTATAATNPVTPSADTEKPDPAILMQQLDEIESANEQILADKNKLLKEQEDLKKQLQTLEADKKQLETKLASQATPAATNEAASTPETTTAEAPDPAILMQQLDAIESANEQILADKKQLEQERDQLKQQLQTLQAGNKQAEATAASPTAATPETANATPDTPDPAILTQQLDEIEAANEQLINAKNKLQSDLETAQQQLKERDQTMSVLTGQVNETKEQLDNSQKELLLANAARASAELNKASLEKQRGSWLPWLLSLIALPIGWLLGRRSKEVTPPLPEATKTATTNTPVATSAPTPLASPELPNAAELSPLAPTATVQAIAANDDNMDAAIKLDIVRAYLDLRDSTAASSLLKEILREGGQRQQQEAREILSFLG